MILISRSSWTHVVTLEPAGPSLTAQTAEPQTIQ
jgi:hypothetical protein